MASDDEAGSHLVKNMTRALPEWVGKTPDTKVPDRVRLRIFYHHNGICHISKRKIASGEPWELEHVVALCNGGEHREGNLAPALRDKHKEKTKADVAEKSWTYKRRLSHAGIRRKGRSFPTNKDQPFRKKIDGMVERR